MPYLVKFGGRDDMDRYAYGPKQHDNHGSIDQAKRFSDEDAKTISAEHHYYMLSDQEYLERVRDRCGYYTDRASRLQALIEKLEQETPHDR